MSNVDLTNLDNHGRLLQNFKLMVISGESADSADQDDHE